MDGSLDIKDDEMRTFEKNQRKRKEARPAIIGSLRRQSPFGVRQSTYLKEERLRTFLRNNAAGEVKDFLRVFYRMPAGAMWCHTLLPG